MREKIYVGRGFSDDIDQTNTVRLQLSKYDYVVVILTRQRRVTSPAQPAAADDLQNTV
jgi:hypothetical protein